MKYYLKTTDEKIEIKVSVYYNKERKMYYVSATPVTRENKGSYVIESFNAYSGVKKILFEVNRQSEKQMKLAIEKHKDCLPILIDWIEQKSHFKIIKE